MAGWERVVCTSSDTQSTGEIVAPDGVGRTETGENLRVGKGYSLPSQTVTVVVCVQNIDKSVTFLIPDLFFILHSNKLSDSI